MKSSKLLALCLSLCLCVGVLPAGATQSTTAAGTDTAVATLTSLGIVSGFPDGSFHPDERLSRGQFCKMAVLAGDYESQLTAASYRTLFDDVPSAHWAASYITLACEKELVNGYGNGSFGPDDPVTLAQAAKVLLGLLGYSQSDIGPFYPEDHLSKAEGLGLLNGLTNSDHALTRGEAAELLYNLLQCETKAGQTYCATLAASVKEDMVLLQAEDGTFTDGNTLAEYTLTLSLPAELEGEKGTLMMDKKGRVTGFVPVATDRETLTLAAADSDGFTTQSGATLALEEDLPVVMDDTMTSYSEAWYALKTGDSVTLYRENGQVTLMVVDPTEAADGSQILGRIDSAAPSLKSASTVTISGCKLSVSEAGKAALKSYAIGDVVVGTLDRAGKVSDVTSGTGKTMVGYATVNGSTAAVTFPGGTVSGDYTNASYAAAKLNGSLVNVRVNSDGELILTALETGKVSDSLDLTARTIGKSKVAGNAKLYERVSDAPAVEIDFSDLLVDSVPASDIEYVGYNAAGEADLILLQNVTRNLYSYGILDKTSRVSGSGSMTTSNTAVAVTNRSGTTQGYVTGSAFTDGGFGGVAGNDVTGKAADVIGLIEVTGLKRSDFSWNDSVSGLIIAENVQVYNAVTEQWVTLSQAKAWSDSFTAYLDRPAEEGGQVRILVVE